MSRRNKLFVLVLLVFAPHILGAAVCARATELPIIVQAVLPSKGISTTPFKLDVTSALAKAGITSTDGKIPAGAPSTITVTHADRLDLTKRDEFKQYGAQIKTAYINYVAIEFKKGNTLTIPTPQIELGMTKLTSSGALTGKERYETVATLPPLAKGVVGTPAELQWDQKQYKKANEILQHFNLAVQLKTTLALHPGEPMPKGVVDFYVHLHVTFVVSLL